VKVLKTEKEERKILPNNVFSFKLKRSVFSHALTLTAVLNITSKVLPFFLHIAKP
jgi:hypothetical protein